MGGEGQPQTQAALVTALSTSDLASKMLLKHRDGLMVELGASSNDLKIEGRVPKTVTAELIKRGHPVKVVDYTQIQWDMLERFSSIQYVKFGGADPRETELL